MGYLTYKGYLETYHWQLLRNATFEYYGKRCYDCHISHWWSHRKFIMRAIKIVGMKG